MKQFLIFIALVSIHSITNASSNYKKQIVDTTIIFNWGEEGVKYKLEISLVGVAGHEGVIPGQGVECYIYIKKTKTTSNQKDVILELKDTCNPQVKQLLFYYDNITQRVLNNRSSEFFLFYEFASDGFDPRVIKYIVVGKNRIFSSEIHLLYDEEKMNYKVITPLLEFLRCLPKNYKSYARQDYSNVLKYIR